MKIVYNFGEMEHTSSLISEEPVISFRLNSYDDIFSSFDIRPYTHRALSVDFLSEIKRASLDKGVGEVELTFYLPENKREESREASIKERLSAHFNKHYRLLLKERRRITRIGLFMTLVGVICMVAATFVIFEDPTRNLFLSFLVVFLEPAAWFLLWEGLDELIFGPKEINSELSFYRKMSHTNAHVHFRSQ